MSSNDLSPSILSSCLWSTAIVRFSQPRMKYLALSKASAKASASPSIVAYRDSAECVNLLPTSVIFHPVLQQNGCCFGQVQCFCSN